MAAAKDAHALTSYFIKQYKIKYEKDPVINRHSARWGFDSILMDMPTPEVKALIDYYLTTASMKRHSLEWFLYNYDKLVEACRVQKEDAARRAKLREESEKRAKEWLESGKRGISGN